MHIYCFNNGFTLQNNIIEPNNLIESSREICLIKCKYYIANNIIC